MNYSCFNGLVGLRFDDRYDIPRTSVPTTATDYLYSSSSGLWVNDLAPNLINLENVMLSAREHEDIEQFLVKLMHGAVSETINSFSTLRASHNQARRLLSNNTSRPVIIGAGAYNHTVSKSGRFVGLEIIPKQYNTVALTIQRIAFHFDQVQTALPVKLYRSDNFAPILEFDLSGNTAKSVTWYNTSVFDDESDLFTDDGILQLKNSEGETYYLGYYEDDVEGYAIKKNFAWRSCGCGGYDPHKTWNPYFSIRGITVGGADLEPTRNLFDIEKVSYEENNFGINISPYVECDLSSLFCDQKQQFAQAIQYKAAIKVLESIWSSTTVNQTTMGDIGQRAGNMAAELKPDFEKVLNQINVDLSGLDSICVPDRSRWGIGQLMRG